MISDLIFRMPELPKAYNPNDVEQKIYQRWEASGFFNPNNLPNAKRRKPFTIAMPPPNVTGELHFGHALGMTVQDILIRYNRMAGRAALWVPGTDHAAIATQVLVERQLRSDGIDPKKLGRERFLKKVWEWKERYGSRIVEQVKLMGASADWSREHFTMDDDLTLAVQTAFVRLYKDGMIYRGERIVNWCPDCRTAISDLEVDHLDTPGKLWHIRYMLTDGSGVITVATTRPETMLGDTAVAVHPDDERYARMVGKTVRLPIVGRDIPIIADPRIEREFGTGAVKVTPGHDPLDFDLGKDHKLPRIDVIGTDGRMTEAAGAGFAGRTVADARQAVLQQLAAEHLVTHEEDYIHSVAYCSRSKTVIEPLVSLQWFLDTKPLAKKAMAAVRTGKVKIVPQRYEKVFFHWMENIRDWNISRQIWWGHRLPVWYKTDKRGSTTIKVTLKHPGKGWVQDEDTLDTWFSSGLWTFSTLGWPKRTKDLARFHPTDVMETGWDILFFWVARMMMFSQYFLGEVPFRTIYLHGLILDQEGKKMSKSKGTGVDPIPAAKKFGMDAVRMSLIIGNAPGQDFRIFEQKIEGYRNFANKLWNIARFTLSRPRPSGPVTPQTLADAWILSRLNHVTEKVTAWLDPAEPEQYNLSAAGQLLYGFLWDDVADWYLEASKVQPNDGVLYHVVEQTLQLLHPFMPFITEELWSHFQPDRLLIVEPWPKPVAAYADPDSKARFSAVQKTVSALRAFKKASGLPSEEIGEWVEVEHIPTALLQTLSRVQLRGVDRLPVGGPYAAILLGDHRFQFAAAYVEKYEAWRADERANLERYISGIERKLGNEQFVARARPEIVAEERQKLDDAKRRLLEL